MEITFPVFDKGIMLSQFFVVGMRDVIMGKFFFEFA